MFARWGPAGLLAGAVACASRLPPPAAPVADEGPPRPRVIVSSDFPPVDVIPGGLGHGPPEKRSDPDDLQSFVRLLVHADELRIEALVAAAGTLANVANAEHVLDMLASYDGVDEALRAHDSAYPTADELRARVVQGLSGTYGKPVAEILGEGKDSEASRRITAIVDASDEPVWLLFWGGTQELAQALWRAQRERPPEGLARFVGKLRVFMIDHQDGTGRWIEEQFPDLFVITSHQAFKGMSSAAPGGDPRLADAAWLEAHVRTGHGALGAAYPPAGWSGRPGTVEGDTPSFLYLLSARRGLGDPADPTQGGWGGRYVPRSPGSAHFEDAPEGTAALQRFRDAFQREFASRMDRCVRPPGAVNRPPMVRLDGAGGTAVVHRRARPGDRLSFDAGDSRDPEGTALSYRWWILEEAGAFRGAALEGASGPRVTVRLPDAATGTLHLVLEVTDAGSPALTRYRRVVLEIEPS